MTDSGIWPWLAIIGLGAFHGLNPAMGWLFAVGLGMQRGSRAATLASLAPIALGHAASVALVVVAVVGFGILVDAETVAKLAGVGLIAVALWHLFARHRRTVRVGMQTGLAGLALWSFAMATTHGAGMMLIPAIVPLCLTGSPATEIVAGQPFAVAIAAVAVHTAAMLAVIAVIAVAVYEWIGVAFLRRGWVNLDLLWSAALAACGAVLLVL